MNNRCTLCSPIVFIFPPSFHGNEYNPLSHYTSLIRLDKKKGKRFKKILAFHPPSQQTVALNCYNYKQEKVNAMVSKYLLYFLFGGIITSAVTYLANNSKGLLAAFVGTLPIITISTFLLIYFNAGQTAVLAYAKGLTIMIIPWMIFILTVIFLSPRLNFISSLVIGVIIQIVIALLILNFDRIYFRP